MKIRAYPFLQQEGQAPRAGEKKEAAPATRRSLSLPQEEGYYRDAEISETLRARMRAYLARVHSAQADLSSLQGDEQHLAEAERLYQQVGQYLAGIKATEQPKNMEFLYLSLGKVREKLEKLKPKFVGGAPEPAATLAQARQKSDATAAPTGNNLEVAMTKLSTELELARQKLTARQKELLAAIAHNLVAVENIAASSSAIRDAAYAQRVMAEVKDNLTTEPRTSILSQTSRENIAALLG
ncbi:MAG: hypothetical protein AB1796_00600 [Bacillota bacterium]